MRKSTRARPPQSQDWKACTAMVRSLFGLGGGESGGDLRLAGAGGVVLGGVVVELAVGHDFADDACLGVVVAEDGDFKFAGLAGDAVRADAADALFDNDFAVELRGFVHSRCELFARSAPC